ncbi:hypothetical protein [Archangium sp. Cb G35]|uniref:hypothetical protein n=1 Tax=Archangium sp. Cb G35 TaxID=1920190 RepID=UPI0011610559|nr:hypothetical protein [Archangium sp. Cb G35]
MPKGWASWYAEAVAALNGDEQRLAEAWCRYLEDEWARGLKPTCPANAFQTVWDRHVTPLGQQSPVVAVPVDTSTDERRAWQLCLAALEAKGVRSVLPWLCQATPVGVVDGELVMRCPDAHFREAVVDEYADMLDEVACSVDLEGIRWVVEDQPAAASA